MKKEPLKNKLADNSGWYSYRSGDVKSAVEWLKKQFDVKETMFDYPFIMDKIEKAFPDLHKR